MKKTITKFVYLNILDADVAQPVEQLIRNQQVSGSIPLVGSTTKLNIEDHRLNNG